MPSTNRGAAASQASEHPAHAPCTAPKASDIFKTRPAILNGGTDALPPDAGLPQPHAPSAAAPGPHAPRPDPGSDCPPPGIPLGEVRPAADLQVSKKPEAEARPASLHLDERSDSGCAAPPWPGEDLPHDLGHDCSPSPSDAWPDMSDSDTAARPLGETRCAVCGEVLPDAAAVDRHIRLHRPSPPPEPAYPFACPVCRARYKTERGFNAHVSRFRHFLPLDDTVHEYIGIPNGTPTPELLHLLAATFVRVSKQLPPTEALARFLSTCRRMEGSGRLPPSRLLLRRGLLGRAWQAVQSEASQAVAVPEPTGEERLAIIRELHPAPMDVSLPEVPHTLAHAQRHHYQVQGTLTAVWRLLRVRPACTLVMRRIHLVHRTDRWPPALRPARPAHVLRLGTGRDRAYYDDACPACALSQSVDTPSSVEAPGPSPMARTLRGRHHLPPCAEGTHRPRARGGPGAWPADAARPPRTAAEAASAMPPLRTGARSAA